MLTNGGLAKRQSQASPSNETYPTSGYAQGMGSCAYISPAGEGWTRVLATTGMGSKLAAAGSSRRTGHRNWSLSSRWNCIVVLDDEFLAGDPPPETVN